MARLNKLARQLQESGIDAFFGWDAVTLGYLHGFNEGAGERFSTVAVHADGRTAMICPALSVNQAERAGLTNIRAWRDGEDPLALFRQLAEDWNLKSSILSVDAEMPARMLLDMQSVLPAALFKHGDSLVSSLMRVKDSSEVANLKRAGEIADQAFPAALAAIRPGITEREIESVLMDEMRRLGGTPTFCIIATGANAAEPHHFSDNTQVKEGESVIMDFGCLYEGYHSDITRTVTVGKASDELKKVYRSVYDAHMSARGSIRVGELAENVDRAARSVIDAAGFGEFFMHRTGHGIGRRIHEAPYIVAGNSQPLEAGECFSVEPGIYLPGNLGVRIENIVTVTPEGHMSLNAEPAAEIIEV